MSLAVTSRVVEVQLNLTDHSDVKNVASVLKSFFRKLPEPLFTDALYDAFIETSTIKDDQTKIKRIRNLLIGLPQHHYRYVQN